MKVKTLLLGSAAAFAVAGGAQAADLSVAEPVEYVKVCEAFGTGYWYIPGTDTCLKIGGYVQFDAVFSDPKSRLNDNAKVTFNTTNGAVTWHLPNNHAASWEMVTEASVQVTAKAMTEYGPLTGFVDLRAKSNNGQAGPYLGATPPAGGWGAPGVYTLSDNYLGTDKWAYLDSAWLELGPLLAGRTGSVYDYGGGYTFDGSSYDSDAAADQVRLSWAMSGFGVQLGIEDPRDRWGTSLSGSFSMPNLVAALTTAQSNWDGKLSFGFAETAAGSGFGAQAAVTIKLDSIAKGDALRLKAAWAQNQVSSFAASNDGSGYSPIGVGVLTGGSIWSALASFQHFWSPQLYSAVTASYVSQDAGLTPDYMTGFGLCSTLGTPAQTGCLAPGGGFNVWSLYGNLVWAPVAGFYAGVEAGYTKVSTSANGVWTGKVRLKRSW